MIITLDSIEAVDRLVDGQFHWEEEDYHEYLHDELGAMLEAKAPLSCRVLREGDLDAPQQEVADVVILKRKMNNIHWLTPSLRNLRRAVAEGGVLLGKAEPLDLRQKRILAGKRRVGRLLGRSYDFVFKRVLPVLPVVGEPYKNLTRFRNRALSKCDVIGRLFYAGFTVHDVFVGDRFLYFRAAGDRVPLTSPVSRAFIFRQPRVGKGEKTIYCYKLRTMYAYAPFIQDYITERNKLDRGGKIRDDFRVTSWGRLLRRYWLDELPMLWNWAKGDLKLVGVRPISHSYFDLYPEEFRAFRARFKPGLIPPFYVDMPKTFDEIVESERRYLLAYREHPWRTDLRYLVRAARNILARGARSS